MCVFIYSLEGVKCIKTS